jgi:hypothetical protein
MCTKNYFPSGFFETLAHSGIFQGFFNKFIDFNTLFSDIWHYFDPQCLKEIHKNIFKKIRLITMGQNGGIFGKKIFIQNRYFLQNSDKNKLVFVISLT